LYNPVEVGFFFLIQNNFPANQTWFGVIVLITACQVFDGRKFDVEADVHDTVQKLLVIPKTELMMYLQHLKECWNKCVCALACF
jgi:hypothetical protein